MNNENLVYHYTSLKTLFNIIENQSIWLTDLHSSMDENELSYGDQLIRQKAKEILDIEETYFLPANNYYALSCTDRKDSYFHFNGYGDGCRGVAIGINLKFMDDALDPNCVSILRYHLNFIRVNYSEEDFNSVISKLFFNLKKRQFLKEYLYTFIFNSYRCAIKRPEFELENEVRFLYCQDYQLKRTKLTKKGDGSDFDLYEFLHSIGLEKRQLNEKCPMVKYACFNNRIRKYYEMSLKKFGLNNVIKQIVIGPKCEQDIKGLEQYLRKKGVKAEVIKSSMKLRD